MIEMSETIQDLAAAFAKAQAKIQNATRDQHCSDYNTAYPSLSAIWAACRSALTKHNLSVIQFPGETCDDSMSMTTILMHGSGQWLLQSTSIPLSRRDEQGFGAAITYARRYALAAVVGICPEGDGDARQRKGYNRKIPNESVVLGKISEGQLAALMAIVAEVGADTKALCTYLGVATLEDLPASQYLAATLHLQQRYTRGREAA